MTIETSYIARNLVLTAVASYPGARAGQEISAWYLLLVHALKIRLFYCKIFRLRHENVVAVIQATPKLLGL